MADMQDLSSNADFADIAAGCANMANAAKQRRRLLHCEMLLGAVAKTAFLRKKKSVKPLSSQLPKKTQECSLLMSRASASKRANHANSSTLKVITFQPQQSYAYVAECALFEELQPAAENLLQLVNGVYLQSQNDITSSDTTCSKLCTVCSIGNHDALCSKGWSEFSRSKCTTLSLHSGSLNYAKVEVDREFLASVAEASPTPMMDALAVISRGTVAAEIEHSSETAEGNSCNDREVRNLDHAHREPYSDIAPATSMGKCPPTTSGLSSPCRLLFASYDSQIYAKYAYSVGPAADPKNEGYLLMADYFSEKSETRWTAPHLPRVRSTVLMLQQKQTQNVTGEKIAPACTGVLSPSLFKEVNTFLLDSRKNTHTCRSPYKRQYASLQEVCVEREEVNMYFKGCGLKKNREHIENNLVKSSAEKRESSFVRSSFSLTNFRGEGAAGNNEEDAIQCESSRNTSTINIFLQQITEAAETASLVKLEQGFTKKCANRMRKRGNQKLANADISLVKSQEKTRFHGGSVVAATSVVHADLLLSSPCVGCASKTLLPKICYAQASPTEVSRRPPLQAEAGDSALVLTKKRQEYTVRKGIASLSEALKASLARVCSSVGYCCSYAAQNNGGLTPVNLADTCQKVYTYSSMGSSNRGQFSRRQKEASFSSNSLVCSLPFSSPSSSHGYEDASEQQDFSASTAAATFTPMSYERMYAFAVQQTQHQSGELAFYACFGNVVSPSHKSFSRALPSSCSKMYLPAFSIIFAKSRRAASDRAQACEHEVFACKPGGSSSGDLFTGCKEEQTTALYPLDRVNAGETSRHACRRHAQFATLRICNNGRNLHTTYNSGCTGRSILSSSVDSRARTQQLAGLSPQPASSLSRQIFSSFALESDKQRKFFLSENANGSADPEKPVGSDDQMRTRFTSTAAHILEFSTFPRCFVQQSGKNIPGFGKRFTEIRKRSAPQFSSSVSSLLSINAKTDAVRRQAHHHSNFFWIPEHLVTSLQNVYDENFKCGYNGNNVRIINSEDKAMVLHSALRRDAGEILVAKPHVTVRRFQMAPYWWSIEESGEKSSSRERWKQCEHAVGKREGLQKNAQLSSSSSKENRHMPGKGNRDHEKLKCISLRSSTELGLECYLHFKKLGNSRSLLLQNTTLSARANTTDNLTKNAYCSSMGNLDSIKMSEATGCMNDVDVLPEKIKLIKVELYTVNRNRLHRQCGQESEMKWLLYKRRLRLARCQSEQQALCNCVSQKHKLTIGNASGLRVSAKQQKHKNKSCLKKAAVDYIKSSVRPKQFVEPGNPISTSATRLLRGRKANRIGPVGKATACSQYKVFLQEKQNQLVLSYIKGRRIQKKAKSCQGVDPEDGMDNQKDHCIGGNVAKPAVHRAVSAVRKYTTERVTTAKCRVDKVGIYVQQTYQYRLLGVVSQKTCTYILNDSIPFDTNETCKRASQEKNQAQFVPYYWQNELLTKSADEIYLKRVTDGLNSWSPTGADWGLCTQNKSTNGNHVISTDTYPSVKKRHYGVRKNWASGAPIKLLYSPREVAITSTLPKDSENFTLKKVVKLLASETEVPSRTLRFVTPTSHFQLSNQKPLLQKLENNENQFLCALRISEWPYTAIFDNESCIKEKRSNGHMVCSTEFRRCRSGSRQCMSDYFWGTQRRYGLQEVCLKWPSNQQYTYHPACLPILEKVLEGKGKERNKGVPSPEALHKNVDSVYSQYTRIQNLCNLASRASSAVLRCTFVQAANHSDRTAFRCIPAKDTSGGAKYWENICAHTLQRGQSQEHYARINHNFYVAADFSSRGRIGNLAGICYESMSRHGETQHTNSCPASEFDQAEKAKFSRIFESNAPSTDSTSLNDFDHERLTRSVELLFQLLQNFETSVDERQSTYQKQRSGDTNEYLREMYMRILSDFVLIILCVLRQLQAMTERSTEELPSTGFSRFEQPAKNKGQDFSRCVDGVAIDGSVKRRIARYKMDRHSKRAAQNAENTFTEKASVADESYVETTSDSLSASIPVWREIESAVRETTNELQDSFASCASRIYTDFPVRRRHLKSSASTSYRMSDPRGKIRCVSNLFRDGPVPPSSALTGDKPTSKLAYLAKKTSAETFRLTVAALSRCHFLFSHFSNQMVEETGIFARASRFAECCRIALLATRHADSPTASSLNSLTKLNTSLPRVSQSICTGASGHTQSRKNVNVDGLRSRNMLYKSPQRLDGISSYDPNRNKLVQPTCSRSWSCRPGLPTTCITIGDIEHCARKPTCIGSGDYGSGSSGVWDTLTRYAVEQAIHYGLLEPTGSSASLFFSSKPPAS